MQKKQKVVDEPTSPIRTSDVTHFEICWYLPNIVGYLRFIFNIIAVRYAFDTTDGKWQLFVFFYSLS